VLPSAKKAKAAGFVAHTVAAATCAHNTRCSASARSGRRPPRLNWRPVWRGLKGAAGIKRRKLSEGAAWFSARRFSQRAKNMASSFLIFTIGLIRSGSQHCFLLKETCSFDPTEGKAASLAVCA